MLAFIQFACFGLVCVLGVVILCNTRVLVVNPRYRAFLKRQGLLDLDDFLALPAVIVSGHPHRNVSRVTLGSGEEAFVGYLKREHRVLWRDHVASMWAGFGRVSRSLREATLLRQLAASGIRCPEWIAAGADGRGRAFLLVREVPTARELSEVLRELPQSPRRDLARRLGTALARLHAAGFHHADLYAGHVLIDANDDLHFVDWQRGRRRPNLAWKHRRRDLAALDATLADELATPRERLACLCAYRHASGTLVPTQALTDIRRHSERLLRKRYVREKRGCALPTGVQNLIWLDGEALCVTHDFHDAVRGQMPDWLHADRWPAGGSNEVTQQSLALPGQPHALFVRRRYLRPWRWLCSWLSGRPFASPELQQAATLFRLQRYGIATPRLLAVGQRQPRPWSAESFLLTADNPPRLDLLSWLRERSSRTLFSVERRQLRFVLRQAGAVLRRLHEAGCYLGAAEPVPLRVNHSADGSMSVEVSCVTGLRTRRRPSLRLARHDLARLRRTFTACVATRTDAARFVLGYLGEKHLTPPARRLVRWFVRAGGKDSRQKAEGRRQ